MIIKFIRKSNRWVLFVTCTVLLLLEELEFKSGIFARIFRFLRLISFWYQTLLRHGANPDLRDEDGKTPLDKARERNDEGHREVMQILQSPGRSQPQGNFEEVGGSGLGDIHVFLDYVDQFGFDPHNFSW